MQLGEVFNLKLQQPTTPAMQQQTAVTKTGQETETKPIQLCYAVVTVSM